MKAIKKTYRYDFYAHGVTQTMLKLWMTCRTQCYLSYVRGLRAVGTKLPLEYGSCVHWILSKLYAESCGIARVEWSKVRRDYLDEYEEIWRNEHPIVSSADREVHTLAIKMADVMLPSYIKRALMRIDNLYADQKKEWIALERNFRIKWLLPDGRYTYLNGRFDGVFVGDKRLTLFETKNFSKIDELGVQDSLPTDLQILLYLFAMIMLVERGELPDLPVSGVLYNVTRRSTLYRRKAGGTLEPIDSYVARVKQDILSPRGMDYYFMRWDMRISSKHVKQWAATQLGIILAEFQRWYDSIGTPNDTTYLNAGALTQKWGQCEMYDAIVHGKYDNYFVKNTPFTELVDDVDQSIVKKKPINV